MREASFDTQDEAYDFIAKNRYFVFGKTESCFLPNEDIKKRFVE